MLGIFFFKQKTAYEMRISDWSSDVCSSDLRRAGDSSGGVMLTIPSGSTFSFRSQAIRGQMIPAHCSTPTSVPTNSAKQNPIRKRSPAFRSEEHTSELQSLMRISYAVFCLKKKKNIQIINDIIHD